MSMPVPALDSIIPSCLLRVAFNRIQAFH